MRQAVRTDHAIDKVAQYLGEACVPVARWNEAQGFWESDNTGEKFMLMVSELGEAMEAHRKSKPNTPVMCDKPGLGHLTGVEEELADVIIRVMDFCGHHSIDLGSAVYAKLMYNLSRPFKHGKSC